MFTQSRGPGAVAPPLPHCTMIGPGWRGLHGNSYIWYLLKAPFPSPCPPLPLPPPLPPPLLSPSFSFSHPFILFSTSHSKQTIVRCLPCLLVRILQRSTSVDPHRLCTEDSSNTNRTGPQDYREEKSCVCAGEETGNRSPASSQ